MSSMEWENEYWIRAYVRDSDAFALIPWQARGLFFLISRKVNAAGRLPLKKNDPVESVATLERNLKAKWSEFKPYLIALLEIGTITIAMDWSVLEIPNFQAAQTAAWASKVRKKASRMRQKDWEDAAATVIQPSHPTILEAQMPVPVAPSIPPMPGTLANHVTQSDKGGVEEVGALANHVTQSDKGGVEGVLLTDTPIHYVTQSDKGGVEEVGALANHVTQSDKGGVEEVGLEMTQSVYSPPFVTQRDCDPTFVTDRDDLSHTNKIDLNRDPSDLSLVREGPEGGEEPPEPEPGRNSDAFKGQLDLLDVQCSAKKRIDTEIERVWNRHLDLWREHINKGSPPVFSDTRRKKILHRIEEFGPETVIEAVEKLWANPWRRNKGYVTLEHAVRTTEQLEMVLNQNLDAEDGPASGTRTNGKKVNRQSYAIQQAGPRADYKGTGTQWHTGEDGKTHDQDGNVIEHEADPFDMGIDLIAQAQAAKRGQ
jgi:hypothetical protein